MQTDCRRLDAVDFTALAKQAHTMVSAVLLGAIAATGVLPLGRPHYEAAIRGERDPQSPGVLANLNGFALGWMSLQGAATDQDTEAATPQAEHGADKVLAFHHLMESTAQRMRTYQNAAYERLFRERMQRIISAEHRSAEAAAMGYPIAPALMPWLALWMMHEDVAEVARLKAAKTVPVSVDVPLAHVDSIAALEDTRRHATAALRCTPLGSRRKASRCVARGPGSSLGSGSFHVRS